MLSGKRIEIGNKKIDYHRFTVKRKSNIINIHQPSWWFLRNRPKGLNFLLRLPAQQYGPTSAFYCFLPVNGSSISIVNCSLIWSSFNWFSIYFFITTSFFLLYLHSILYTKTTYSYIYISYSPIFGILLCCFFLSKIP